MKRNQPAVLRHRLSFHAGIAVIAAAVAFGLPASAGDGDGGGLVDGPGQTPTTAPDHQLRGIMRDIDRRSIEPYVRTLVGFGTRHTLSSQTDPVRGIGAATELDLRPAAGYAARPAAA